MKKLLALFLALQLTFTHPLAALEETQVSVTTETTTEELPEKKESWLASCAHLIFATLALELCYLTGDERTQTMLLNQFAPANLIKNVAGEYSKTMLTTFMHELGHASVAKMVIDAPIDIHLGAGPNQDKNEALLKNDYLTVHSLHPLKGYSSYQLVVTPEKFLHMLFVKHCLENKIVLSSLTQTDIEQIFKKITTEHQQELELFMAETLPVNKRKQAAILLAGGAAGMLSNFVVKSIGYMIQEKKISGEALAHGAQADSIMVNHFINMLIPSNADGHDDASKLYVQCLGVPQKHLATISIVTQVLPLLTEYYFAYRERTEHAELHSVIFIGLCNYFMRGFLRLRV